jgi:hypothetical protein
MKLTHEDGLVCAKAFQDYFGNFDRIDEYMRDQKINSLSSIPQSLFPPEDDLFSDFSMHPNDMDIQVCQIPTIQWQTLLSITSSHVNASPVGRRIEFAIKEKNTDKFLGFIRLASPVINCKPRNEMLSQVFTQKSEWNKRFNRSAMMGFAIVPSQPFGFNYLGGKLLAAICCSHAVREIVNEKYDMNLCLFETTSLYGSSKQVSQYDGMKPYVRYKGLTDSNFLPMMHGKSYSDLRDFVYSKVGPLVEEKTSSKKLTITMSIISLTKAALKGTPAADEFDATIEKAKSLTEKKRYYISNYGFSNYIDYVNCKTDTLIKDKENYDKFELEKIVQWWKQKATNRYESLKTEGRLRNKLEVWTNDHDIDIMR